MPGNSSADAEGFLGQVVDEFGIQWTSIAVFSSLIFSAFGLSRYLSIAAWIVGTVVAFGIAFVFRRQVSGRFSRVAVIAIPILIALLVIGYFLVTQRSSLPTYLEHHQAGSSFYLSLAVMLPLAVLLLSYRQQERYLGAPFPQEIQRAVREGVLEAPVYRRDIDYRVSLLNVNQQQIEISVELAYTAVNRTAVSQSTVIALTPLRRQAEFFNARIGGRNYDVEDPQYRTEFGLQIPINLEPRTQTSARMSAKITYNIYDSDTFCSWVPATNLELHVVNPFSQSIWLAVESLLREKVAPDVGADGSSTYRTSQGVLPHQGFRVSWGPRVSPYTTSVTSEGAVV